MRKSEKDTLWLMMGIIEIVMVTEIIRHSVQFAHLAERMTWSLESPDRCWFCGYRYDHPIVRHDDTRLYCGW